MEIETINGRPSLWYVDRARPESWRRNPWGFAPGVAATSPEGSRVTWDEAAKAARADFTVEKRPTFTVASQANANGKRALRVPGSETVVRTSENGHEETPLAVVTESYGLVQNREVLTLLEAVGFVPDSLAVLEGGSRLYAQSVLCDDQVRDGDTGKVRTFRTAMWSQGVGAILTGETMTGIVCINTYAKAKRDLDIKIVHRKNASARVEEAAEKIAREVAERSVWLDTARRMAETKIDRAATSVALARSLDTEAKHVGDLSGVARGIVTDISAILRRADASTGVIGDGSLWDVFQAITFYASHERTVRGLDGAAAEIARQVSPLPAFVTNAWDVLGEVVAAR